MLTVSFQLRAKTVRIPLRMNTERCRREEWHIPIGMPTVCLKTFPAETTKILSTRNSSILMMSSSEYMFLESEYSFTKYISLCLNTKIIVSMVTVFENERVSVNTSESDFSISGEVWLYKTLLIYLSTANDA